MLKNNLAAIFIFIFCASLLGANDLLAAPPDIGPSRTIDGRFSTGCYQVSDVSGNLEICQVSFYSLLSNPERYDGRFICITGFLVDYFGTATLFPRKDSYEAQISMDGISIRGKIPDEFTKDLKSGIWAVTLVGKFDAKYDEAQIPTAGLLKELRTIKRVPTTAGR